MVNGEVVTRKVTVRNSGNEELVIEAVSTSCGCTQPTLEPMAIPPDENGTLRIVFDSEAHGEELTGALMRQVFIASNGAGSPRRSLNSRRISFHQSHQRYLYAKWRMNN